MHGWFGDGWEGICMEGVVGWMRGYMHGGWRLGPAVSCSIMHSSVPSPRMPSIFFPTIARFILLP